MAKHAFQKFIEDLAEYMNNSYIIGHTKTHVGDLKFTTVNGEPVNALFNTMLGGDKDTIRKWRVCYVPKPAGVSPWLCVVALNPDGTDRGADYVDICFHQKAVAAVLTCGLEKK